MEFNFDKEIDAFLRNEARNVKVVSNENIAHLDADEISAFAENTLPNKARIRATKHLANCDNCRISLANMIALNSEFPDETPAKVVEREIVATPVPWYRKIFAAPNLAYSLGALLLVFSGLIAFVAVQNFTSSNELSQINEQQFNTNSAAATNMNSAESDAFANANTADMSFNSNMDTANAPENSLTDSNMNLPKQAESQPAPAKRTESAEVSESAAENNKNSDAAPPAAQTGNFADSGATLSKPAPRKENISEPEEKTDAEKEKSDEQKLPVMSRKSVDLKRAEESAKEKRANIEKTSVGGKNFKRENNAWIDVDYQNQKTTKITRGTEEYKKLDKDLRVIVENLGGIVIIVWKEKAYRIQ